MKGFYEKNREDEGKLIVSRNAGHIFPAHFHRNLEIFIVRKGEYRLSIGEQSLTVGSGMVAIIDSYEIHSYDARENIDADDCVLVIPYDYVTEFTARRQGRTLKNTVVKDDVLCQSLLKIVDEYLYEQADKEVQKSAVHLLLSLLYPKLAWTNEKTREESSLVREILAYIQENYTGDVSRSTIARVLGYTEAHISRVFHRYLNKGISQYVNELRLSHIDRALARGDNRSVIELIYDAGFKSQQTYYRFRAKNKE